MNRETNLEKSRENVQCKKIAKYNRTQNNGNEKNNQRIRPTITAAWNISILRVGKLEEKAR